MVRHSNDGAAIREEGERRIVVYFEDEMIIACGIGQIDARAARRLCGDPCFTRGVGAAGLGVLQPAIAQCVSVRIA